MNQEHAKPAAPARNPLYVKIGKRIRQARLMAKESNSRALSERLGWSGGRINNFETGASTPGVEETLTLCQALGVEPGWLTYGTGAPRAVSRHNTRYRNLTALLDQAEREGTLPELLAAIRLPMAQLEALRAHPFKPIPDPLAHRLEQHLQQPRGWLDEPRIEPGVPASLPQEMRDLLSVYLRLSEPNKKRLQAMAELLLDE